MFKPKYAITPKLLANIKRIAALTAELNSRRFPKVVLARLERSAREISSFSSTSIEGNPLPLTEVKKILKNRPSNIRDSEREVLNYNQAFQNLNQLINRGKVTLNLKLILAVHKTITRGLIASYRCGKIRREPVFVNDPRSKKTIYWPPDHQDVSSLLNDLIDYIVRQANAIDPLILAALFHKQFVIIHPFIDGNGRTARLVTKALLAAMGLDTFNLFSFENYYNNNVAKYFQEVGVLGNYYDIKDKINFTSWLEYFTDGIIDELLRVEKEMAASARGPASILKPYHHKILEHIKKHGYITDREYAKITERAKPTRSLDFKKLIHLGLIEKQGKGKATYYQLKQA